MSTTETPWWTERYARLAEIDPAFAGAIDSHAEDQVELMTQLLRLEPGARVLDLGCGAGRHAILLAERGMEVVGVDWSEPVLELAADTWARRHADEAGPRFVKGDMRTPPVEGTFDAVIAMDVAFGIFDDDADHLQVLSAASELLAPDGALLLELFNPYFWSHAAQTRHYPAGALAADAHLVRSWRFDADLGRVEDHITVFRTGAEPETVPPQSLRAWTPTEIRALVQAAGLSRVAIHGTDGWRTPDGPRRLDAVSSAFMWVVAHP
ncbi:MAG: class I SAM-dependent methyltransferase [Alphaproteobacteria bacterium]|nr:class I SAM-dependent methyltransferase [Alphaproteobacteria bacterium]